MQLNLNSNPSTIEVDTLIDENDGDLSVGDVSLREAITAVEEGGTITFAQQLATSDTGAGQGVIALSLGELFIDKSVTIKGLGKDQLTVSGDNQSRVFSIEGNDVVLDSLTISNGGEDDDGEGGGAILTRGNLLVLNSLITGNSSGISNGYYDRPFNDVDLRVENTTIENNEGDGIVSSGTITIASSRIANNDGFGVENYNGFGGDTIVTNSVITDNRLDGLSAKGGAYGTGYAKVISSTISGNGGTAVNASGGRFYSGGTIEVSDSVITNNGRGLIAGDETYGSITVESSTVSGNKGIALSSYDIAVKNSSIVDNQGIGLSANDIAVENSTIAQNQNGGIRNRPRFYQPISTSLTVNNSTISGNGSAAVKAGGIVRTNTFQDGYYVPATVRITNTTISGNVGSVAGGILIESVLTENGEPYDENKTVLENTIIAGNIGPAPDISAENVESLGYNLIGDGSDTDGFVETDLVGDRTNPINPLLGTLQDNGGTTLTQVPLADSPAIDAGNPAATNDSFDQRGDGFDRVVDSDGDGTARIDIGAVEAAPDGLPTFHIIEGDNRRNRLFGAGGRDFISGFKGPDTLRGRGDDDILLGGAGHDRLLGDSGDDILNGGLGRDKLSGGGGKDTFVYEGLHEGKDIILDFKVGQDLIDLSIIFDSAQYDSATPFEDYIQLGQVGRNTRLEVLNVNASRGGQDVFIALAVIRNVAPSAIDNNSFVV